MDKLSALDLEKRQANWFVPIFLLCAATGIATFPIQDLSVPVQWSYLVHMVLGVLLSLLSLPYLWRHFRRTFGQRRFTVFISGLASACALLAMVLSGIHIAWFGQRERLAWIFDLHIASSLTTLTLVIFHLLLHWRTAANKRTHQQRTFTSLERGILHNTAFAFGCIIVVIIALSLAKPLYTPEYRTTPIAENYQYLYGEHPFRPSQTETYHGKFVDVREIATSNQCAHCHEDIASQWRQSIHNHAADDPTYVRNVSLLAEKKGIAATRYCEGCHAPIALLTGELSQGGEHGGIDGTIANVEGVGCVGCHGISRIAHLNGVASFEFKPPRDYLFGNSEHLVGQEINRLLMRVKPEIHKADVAPSHLERPEVCATCHTQFMDKSMNNWGWVKMQDEFGAWLASPYSRQSDQHFSNDVSVRCQDCHMALTLAKNDPSSNTDGMVRAHNFPAANTVHAFLNNDEKQLDAIKNFMKNNKVRISIEEPNRSDATQTLQTVDESLRTRNEAPYYFYLGEKARLDIVVTNQGVGHNFPGGTIDINEAWVAITVTDATGKLVFESGNVRADNTVDPNARQYRELPIDRNGKLVWRHDLFNRVGESEKNVIPAGKSDIVNYEFGIPDWTKGPLVATATLRYRKLNDRYARWALDKQYVSLPIIDMARDTLAIPLRIKPEADSQSRDEQLSAR